MEMNGGFLVTKIKQLGDRIFEKILSEKNIDAFNGAQGRILYGYYSVNESIGSEQVSRFLHDFSQGVPGLPKE